MTIFKVEFQTNTYQFLCFDGDDESVFARGGAYSFDGDAKAVWEYPPVRIYNPRLKRGDFMSFCSGSGALVARYPAADEVWTELELAGQILPVEFDGEKAVLLNITEVANCLDHENCEWVYGRDGVTRIRCQKFAFRTDLVPESSLFKIPETVAGTFYAHTGYGDPEDTFIHQYEALGLTGLRFVEIFREDESRVT